MKKIVSITVLITTCVVLLTSFINTTVGSAAHKNHSLIKSEPIHAMLCSSCGFGTKKDNCVKCDKWVGSSSVDAILCSSCGFGTKKDNCVKCDKWIGSNGVEAVLCSSCGFGTKKKNCVKCDKWAK